jgi:cytochrome c peroxidase
LIALTGCADPEPPLPPLPWARELLPAAPAPAENPTTEAKVALGRLLFYDPVLSRDHATACATCHSEIWGMGDGLSVSVGVDGVGPTGPGRDGPHKTRRNAQTLWNVAHRERLFWDGRAASLEAQALEPITAVDELGRATLDEVLEELVAIDEYRALFEAAFPGEPIDAVTLGRALASFQRTIIAGWGPYDRYVAGDARALSPEAREGMFLFAEAGCAGCHAPPRFESERYADRGLGDDDLGRFEVSGELADVGRFRVPTLRNVRETGPYFHDGSAATLEEAVAYEVGVAVELGESRALSEDEIAAIATFLRKGLIDRAGEPHRPKEVPSGLAVPADGFRIPR